MINVKPILFSTVMVQAILEDRKTQTRRIVKNKWALQALAAGMLPSYVCHHENTAFHDFGLPGDILWVRETHARIIGNDGVPYYAYNEEDPLKGDFVEDWDGWTPSIFMPREACRLFLKIKAIRIEYLQNISDQDAMAEGIYEIDFGISTNNGSASIDGGKTFQPFKPKQITGYSIDNNVTEDKALQTARSAYANLWDKINGKRAPWAENPFVWVLEFERVNKPENF